MLFWICGCADPPEMTPVNGHAEWDGHDAEGNVVVRGLYLYRVVDPGNGTVSGKFAVITK